MIPPLRERPDDIPLLVRSFVKDLQKRMGKEIESIPKKTMQALQAYAWPGNIRELRNLIEHAMIVSKGKTLDVLMPKSAASDSETAGSRMAHRRTGRRRRGSRHEKNDTPGENDEIRH
jgi:DNA-binding NtrC family response regulator